MVVLAAGLALGATFGLFGMADPPERVGSFEPGSATPTTTPGPEEQTVVVDVPGAAPAAPAPVGPSVGPVAPPRAGGARVSATTTSTVDGSDRADDDRDRRSNSGSGSSNSGSGSSGSGGGGADDD